MTKLTQDEFVQRSNEVHGDKYDYSKSIYVNSRTKVIITCPKHGEFEQNPKNHYNGQGCSKCYTTLYRDDLSFLNLDKYIYLNLEINKIKSNYQLKFKDKKTGYIYYQSCKHHKEKNKPIKIDSQFLINEMKNIHNNKYEYLTNMKFHYITDKIQIKDRESKDIFKYELYRHLIEKMEPNELTLNRFKIKSNIVHNNKYDYSKVEFGLNKDKVIIICPDHSEFKQNISNHVNLGHGCPECSYISWDTDRVKKEFIKLRGNEYDYSKVVYENIDKKVKIVCRKHGEFEQNIHKHLKFQGCPKCNISAGESRIMKILNDFKIGFEYEKSFDGCRDKNPLRFDFYIPKMNLCIEYDGKQHFELCEYLMSEEEFENLKRRDLIKNIYCKDNDIKLLRIKYTDFDNIENILKEKINIEK